MIPPDDPAFAVDRSDPVAIAIESHAEIELLLGDERAQVGQVGLDSGIRVMIGKIAVDFSEQQVVFPRHALGEQFQRRTGSAVARVPAHAQPGEAGGICPRECSQEALDILFDDIEAFDCAQPVDPVPLGRHRAKLLDIGAEEGPATKYHLEAIVIGGIVAASYLNAAMYLFG